MKQLYMTLVLLLCCTVAFAQKDFRQGYIIQGSDTIKGFVDYRGDSRSAQTATFKPTLEGEELRFTPTDLAGYGFTNEKRFFVSKYIPSTSSPDTQTTPQFVNILAKGPANLYYYRDQEAKDHYYIEKDTLLLELYITEQYLVKDIEGKHEQTRLQNHSTHQVKLNKYWGILSMVFADCPQISDAQIKKTRLSHKSLIAVTSKYNECKSPVATQLQEQQPTTYNPHRRQVKLLIGPTVMYVNSNVSFTGDLGLPVYVPADEASSTNTGILGGGMSLNLLIPALSEKISLQADLLYVPLRYSSTLVNRSNSHSFALDFDMAMLKLPLQLRYTYPKGLLRPFVNAGFSSTIFLSDKNTLTTTQSNDQVRSENFFYGNMLRKYLDGYTAGVGLMYPLQHHEVSVEGRFEKTSNMVNLQGLAIKNRMYHLMLRYSF